MKKLILIAAMFVSTNLYADLCANISDAAGAIMTARQSTMPMSELMSRSEGSGESISALMVQITKDAYRTSRLTSQSSKELAALEFKNKWYSLCYESMNKNKKPNM